MAEARTIRRRGAAKMLLKARVPNEGARRLAQYLLTGPLSIEGLAREALVTPMTLLRLVEGDLEPGAELSLRLSLCTGHAVVSRDWRSAPAGGWFERAAPREYRRAA